MATAPKPSPTFKSKGVLTLPAFQLKDGQEYYLEALGELITKPKTGKGGKVEKDEAGDPKTISILTVRDMLTNQRGEMVVGAIGVSALGKAGTIKGRGFKFLRHPGPAGRPKKWEIEEVEVSPEVDQAT